MKSQAVIRHQKRLREREGPLKLKAWVRLLKSNLSSAVCSTMHVLFSLAKTSQLYLLNALSFLFRPDIMLSLVCLF